MFDDLSDAELATLRGELRTAALNLAQGKATAEIRYGEMGHKFHPPSLDAAESFLNRVIAEIARRAGTCTVGAIFPVTG